MKLLMSVHVPSSQTVRLSYQELIKKLVVTIKMKVSDLVKNLIDIAKDTPKFNEVDNHLNSQQAGGDSRKNNQLGLTVRAMCHVRVIR